MHAAMVIKVPSDLTPAEVRAYRRIAAAVIAAGLDADARRELIADLCRLETQLHDLREAGRVARDGGPAAFARAANNATAERRRLHQRIFQGAKKPDAAERRATAEAVRQTDSLADVRQWFIGEAKTGWPVLLETTETLRKWWRDCRDEIMAEWLRHHPGRRPRAWWVWEAKEPRRRLGGIGEPVDRPGMYGMSSTGLPDADEWPSAEKVHYYGRGAVIDPADPPRFESQAAYLKRTRRFAPGEAARLRPADFEPEVVKA